jgi:hypothetical protein
MTAGLPPVTVLSKVPEPPKVHVMVPNALGQCHVTVGGASCRVPFIPAVYMIVPVAPVTDVVSDEAQPLGFTLEQPVNDADASRTPTATPAPPPWLEVVTPHADELQVVVQLMVPPDVVMTTVVVGWRCSPNVVSFGYTLAHGVVSVLHNRVADAVAAPAHAITASTATTTRPTTLR